MTRPALIVASLPILLAAGAGRARADGAFPNAQAILLPSDRPGQIVVAATFGLVFTDDGGGHWQYACESRDTLNGRLYSVGPAPDDRLFALSDYGLAVSEDAACIWKLGSGPFDGGLVRDYFADPVDPAHVLVVAQPPGLNGMLRTQVFESRDGGLTFPTVLYPGPEAGGISGVEIARSDPRVVYVTMFETTAADSLSHPRLLRSSNGGTDWQTIDLEPMFGTRRIGIAAVDPENADRIFLRASGATGQAPASDSIAVSADGGQSFAVPLDLPGGTLTSFFARQNGTLFATGTVAGSGVAFRSRDGGATFEPWHASMHPLAFAERDGTLFAAADNSVDGVALASSDDDGDSWTVRMKFEQIEGIKSCVQAACVLDCEAQASIALFPTSVCAQAADAGAEAAAAPGGGCGSCSMAGTGGTGGLVALIGALGLAAVRRARRRSATRMGALTFGVALLAAPVAAHGYVQLKSSTGVSEHLPSSCLPVEVHLDGFPGVDQTAMRDAVTAAARAWSRDTNACTSLSFALTFAAGPGPPARDDGLNVIGARSDGWCSPGTDAAIDPAPDAGTMCNAPSATAATTVFAAIDGRIVDGDTELNTATFAWAALDAQGNPSDRQDLQSALTHEIGHLIGLDHPCWSGIGERATDDAGNPVPNCYDAPAAIADDTMFPTINPGDISRRTLSPDAIRAVCSIYPAGRAATCPAPSAQTGCAVAGDPVANACGQGLGFLLVLRWACSRRRKSVERLS